MRTVGLEDSAPPYNDPMPTDFSFRLSLYLSLALACGCLGYAEADLLPSGAVIAGLVLASLAVAFRCEGRYELSLASANRLGVVLFVAGGVWLVAQFANSNSLLRTVPWPAALLPYIGTMLLAATPAKLLRPKHAGDWWALQGMGLAAVMLACALAEDGVFGLLLALYAVAAVGGLSLFYLKQEAGQVPPAPRDPLLVGGVERLLGRSLGGGPAVRAAVVASAPARVRAVWRPAVGWVAVAAAVALPLFFLTPRSNGPRWSMSGVSLETGYDSPQMTDLTRTGEMRVNTEGAFEVTATDSAGRPFDGLPLGQRWRGVSLVRYDAGRWRGSTNQDRLIDFPSQAVLNQLRPPTAPPALAPGMVRLDFALRGKTTEPPLADPVRWVAGGGSPAWAAGRAGRVGPPWMQRADAGFGRYSVANPAEGYIQFVYPPGDSNPDLGTGFDPHLAGKPDPTDTLRELPAGLKELPKRTRELLDELVAAGKVAARATASPGFLRDGRVEPADWQAVATAFRDQLAAGGYEYTLKLRRTDKQSDPVEDFLYRTKAGNCERFAAALVLQCRAVGVPARHVIGFKGLEPLGDGKYLVRQDHAHAWAEVLVSRPAANAAGYRWHWLSLDPTPDGGDEADTNPSLIGTAARGGWSFFSDFIIGYNADRRQQVADDLTALLTGPDFHRGLAGLLVVAGLAAGGWRLRRSFRRPAAVGPTGVAWYERVVQALAAAGHPLPPGRTPADHARAVGRVFRTGPSTAAVAGLPTELTERFYRERFGGEVPSAVEQAEIDAAVDRLAAAITSRAAP